MMRSLAAVAAIALMAAPVHAQTRGGNPATLSQQRAGKSTAPKADEKAYKDALSRIPAADKKSQADPWKTMR
jgi:hypothetical protein